jgi:hypothetical protein
MSIIKSVKQILGLHPAAENHFWDGSVANQLSLKRGTPDAPGADVISVVDGRVTFPNTPEFKAPLLAGVFTGGQPPLDGGQLIITAPLIEASLVDTNNCFDQATGRFTPNIPGYYLVTCNAVVGNIPANSLAVSIFKNGGRTASQFVRQEPETTYFGTTMCLPVFCNGSTDYIQLAISMGKAAGAQPDMADGGGSFGIAYVRAP